MVFSGIQGKNRLFILASPKAADQVFNGTKGYRYCIQNVKIANCIVLIDIKSFLDQPYENIWKIPTI